MPTVNSVPQGELLSPDTEMTDIDSPMHDIHYLDEGSSSNMQDSDDEGFV